MVKSKYTMSAAALAQRRAAAAVAAAAHSGGAWKTVRLRAEVVARIDAQRGAQSRGEYIRALVG